MSGNSRQVAAVLVAANAGRIWPLVLLAAHVPSRQLARSLHSGLALRMLSKSTTGSRLATQITRLVQQQRFG